jgi:hypothetical protein
MAMGLIDGRAGDNEEDRRHLRELAALVAPEDLEVEKLAINAYVNEAHDLYERKAARTIVKLFDTVNPVLADLASKAKDPEVLQEIAWAHSYHADALLIVKRADEAIAITDEGLKHLDPSWKDYAKLRRAYIGFISDYVLELMHAKDYPNAVKFITPRFELCKSDELCAKNVSIIYQQQAIDHEKDGHWSAAQRGLQECIALLPKVSGCAELLSDLESRH